MAEKKNVKSKKPVFDQRFAKILVIVMWLIGLIPLFAILYIRYIQTDESTLPSVSMLESQEELLATTVFASDGMTSLGKYWRVNRTNVNYNEISDHVVSALIATEDERYENHSGIDSKAVARAIANLGSAGGASTITQQLAKLIYTLKERDDKRKARLDGSGPTEEEKQTENMSGLEKRFYEKIKENIIALRLERRYTKREIITMYLNQFDFLQNAVGINTASKVYYNKTVTELKPEEAAMLVGMVKNPGLYNPFRFKIRDYRSILARKKGISEDKVSLADIQSRRAEDSLRAVDRRNVVLYKWRENSEKMNPSLTSYISQAEYDSLIQLPLLTDYQSVDHKEGMAPYFREHLRGEITNLLAEKDENGKYKYAKPDGSPYNIYEDGLKIYTSLDVNIQKHAEYALKHHLKTNLQEPFTKNNKRSDYFPFSFNWKHSKEKRKELDNQLMRSARLRSERYRNAKSAGRSDAEIRKEFETAVPMNVFSWSGEIDTILSPNDSIRYYKNFIRAGLLSIEPQTGFIKAWVGGPNIDHFAYDHVGQGKRQVGSTIKPFIYSAGMRFGVITPYQKTPNIPYCVDIQKGQSVENMESWCPTNSGADMNGEDVTFQRGLEQSMNNITVAVMSKMGGIAGPRAVAKLMRDLNINIRDEDVVPAMCLGVMDLSLVEMVGAQCAFVNRGIYTQPTALIRIEDRRGNIIFEHIPDSKEAMSEELAYATLSMMRGVVQRGTAASLRGTWRGDWGGITQPTAGKTGTTQNNSDGWFMGLTPDLVTGVWVGGEDMLTRFRSMEWGQGARMALPIYGYMMQRVYKDPNIHISTDEFEIPFEWRNSIYNERNAQGSNQDGSDIPDFGFGGI
jgi:penicillin-binding protein 1A